MKLKTWFPLFTLIFLFLTVLPSITAQDSEHLTITTYYPSPVGSYNEMTVASRQAIGDVNGDGQYNTGDMAVDGSGNPINGTLTVKDRLGIGTRTPEFKLSLDNDGGIIAKGIYGSGADLVTSGAGARLIWYPKKAAFRAGYVDPAGASNVWDNANVGPYSVAFGTRTKASGDSAMAVGWGATASGAYSLAFGVNTSASGDFGAMAGGQDTTASGQGAVALGLGSQASGNKSFAMGYAVIASGIRSVAIGQYVTASGNWCFALGDDLVAGPTAHHAFIIGDGNGGTLTNNIPESLMVGFNSNNIPTLFVGPSAGSGTTGNVGAVEVNGTLRIGGWGAGAATYNVQTDDNGVLVRTLIASSRKYKKDIKDLVISPNNVLKLRPVKFRWKETNAEDIGLIAEEVDQVIKDLVTYDKDGNPNAVKYDKLALYLLDVVREQQKEIEVLKEEISLLKKKVSVKQ